MKQLKPFKNLTAVAKAYKEGKLGKKHKLVLADGTATLSVVPTDEKGRPLKDAAPQVLYQASVDQVTRDALKLAGVPTS